VDIFFKIIQEFKDKEFVCSDDFIKQNTYFNSLDEMKNENIWNRIISYFNVY
jgi:hypothetical protein